MLVFMPHEVSSAGEEPLAERTRQRLWLVLGFYVSSHALSPGEARLAVGAGGVEAPVVRQGFRVAGPDVLRQHPRPVELTAAVLAGAMHLGPVLEPMDLSLER